MKKINSLKGKKLFDEVYKKGNRIQKREVQLIYLNTGKRRIKNNKIVASQLYQEIKVGIPINRKYGNSVSRNKAKRRIRVICRELLTGIDESYYFIIRPKEEFKKLSYSESKQVIELLFKNAGVLRS